ncbi:MAG: polysaccharide pyruvyl transferase CsaB [Clostridiales bacterium]|nr:polysaccharide pyruvyl transferase CsaB [Clostridiales bacterium]
MKILIVTMSMNIGGAETHILELCRELCASGDDVTLASFGGVYADEAAASGVKCVTLPLHTKRPGAVLRSYSGLRRLILDGQFDLVHAHARIPAFICGLLWNTLDVGDGRKFRFVTTAHLNFDVNPLWRRISRWGERVMAVSDDIADYLVDEYGIPRDRIHTTVNGIDTEKFSPAVSPAPVLEKHGLDPARRRVVTMSRLDPDRADPAFRLLEIAPRLAEAHPDVDILIVGGGSEEEKIEARAAEINEEAGRALVTVTGPVSNTGEYCAAADIFVGVSRSALEAMAAAKPVILAGGQGALGVFDETKVKDAVSTNFCCRTFPLASADALYDEISALLDASPDTLRAMGDYNRATVIERYGARRMADDYRRMYEKTLASPIPFHLRRTPADVIVSGYYGFGNLGDESLLDVISASLAEAKPGVKIAALTKNGRRDARRTGLSCVSRFRLPAVMREIRRAKVLLSGGGSLLQDATSRRSLKYYAGLLAWAEKHGTKAAVYANGIGPIRDPKNRALAGRVVSHADRVSVRDPDSGTELVSLGVPEGKIRLTADPAFLIRGCPADRLDALLRALDLEQSRYFAVSLRPLGKLTKTAKNAQLTDRDRLFLSETVAALVEIAHETGLSPLILPMQKSQDSLICAEAVRLLDAAGVKSASYLPVSAPDLIGLLGGARFAVAMRLHAVIFASSAATPVIALSYDPKVASMMRALGQPTSVELAEALETAGALTDAIVMGAHDVLAREDDVRASLADRAREMRERCAEDVEGLCRMI